MDTKTMTVPCTIARCNNYPVKLAVFTPTLVGFQHGLFYIGEDKKGWFYSQCMSAKKRMYFFGLDDDRVKTIKKIGIIIDLKMAKYVDCKCKFVVSSAGPILNRVYHDDV